MTTAEVTPQKVVEIKAQPGPQTQFMQSSADIIVYGGGAGGGKTFALLMEPLRYAVNVPNFTCVMFRRNTVQVRNPGGLWDESETRSAPQSATSKGTCPAAAAASTWTGIPTRRQTSTAPVTSCSVPTS